MKGNTVKTCDGIEVYTHEIYRLSDEYINTELNNPEDIYDVSVFTGMILYISDNISKPSNDDIQLLDDIFNIYIRLCCKYRILPTLECFSMLIKVNPNTISAWINGEYRNNVYYDMQGNYIKDINTWRINHKGEEYRTEPSSSYSLTAKKWRATCKNFLVNSLSNSRGTDANKIFIAKAAYGMVETAPALVQNPDQVQRSIEQIQQERAQRLGETAVKELPVADF